MRRGIVGSAALHIGVIGATLFAWTSTREPNDEPSEVIPVEMVDIADTTNLRAQAAEEPKPVEQPQELVSAAPDLTPPDVTVPEPQEETPPPPEETAEADEPTPKPAPPPPPVQKPHPPKPQANFDPDRILALLDKRAPRSAPAAPAPRAAHTQTAIGSMNAQTMDIQAAFLEQMRECWNFPAGAPHPEQLIVNVEIYLTRDGHLAGAPQLSGDTRSRMSGDPYMRAAAEAALRAISICEPYRLPADRYESWRDLNLTFDPSKMVGR